MESGELKKILEISSILGKGFSPITEYTYFSGKNVKVTNMESFLEIELEQESPFSGCVLSAQLSKFLDSLKKDTDLTFTTTENVLTISYGKKNKFAVPMEPLADFPDSPSIKYLSDDLKCSVAITEDFTKELEMAIQFASKSDVKFNGVYLKYDDTFDLLKPDMVTEFGYWGHPDAMTAHEEECEYTPLRQNIILLCAAINGEL